MTFGGCAISTRKIWLVSNGRITRVAYTGWDMRGEFYGGDFSFFLPRFYHLGEPRVHFEEGRIRERAFLEQKLIILHG